MGFFFLLRKVLKASLFLHGVLGLVARWVKGGDCYRFCAKGGG